MQKVKFEDFVPGRILYHVYGINRTKTEVSETEINKRIITSKPFKVSLGTRDAWFVKFIEHYIAGDEVRSYKTEGSLADMGVEGPGEDYTPYNLNRIHVSKEDALLFCRQLQRNEFTRDIDIAYANHTTPEDEETRLQNLRDEWNYHMDWDPREVYC